MAGSYFSAILLLMILSALFLGPGMAVHRERKGGGPGGGGGGGSQRLVQEGTLSHTRIILVILTHVHTVAAAPHTYL